VEESNAQLSAQKNDKNVEQRINQCPRQSGCQCRSEIVRAVERRSTHTAVPKLEKTKVLCRVGRPVVDVASRQVRQSTLEYALVVPVDVGVLSLSIDIDIECIQ
jgi:hypothetical protein